MITQMRLIDKKQDESVLKFIYQPSFKILKNITPERIETPSIEVYVQRDNYFNWVTDITKAITKIPFIDHSKDNITLLLSNGEKIGTLFGCFPERLDIMLERSDEMRRQVDVYSTKAIVRFDKIVLEDKK
jgi:hypothetical protein